MPVVNAAGSGQRIDSMGAVPHTPGRASALTPTRASRLLRVKPGPGYRKSASDGCQCPHRSWQGQAWARLGETGTGIWR